MRIIICGAGQVGFNLARYLIEHNNHVTVIDNSHTLISSINERLDVRAVYGQASYPEILEKAQAAEADMIIAVTQSDEVNIITCEVAHALFNVKTKIGRIRNQSYLHPKWNILFSPSNLNIDYIISPEIELAHAISRSLMISGAFNIIALADNRIKVIGVRCSKDAPLLNTPISHLSNTRPELDISVIGIIRGDENFIPIPQDIIQAGDEIYFIVDSNKVDYAMKAFGYSGYDTKKLIIMGGGSVGLRLAQEVENIFPFAQTFIIENNKERGYEIAEKLNNTIVLNGDCLDTDVLLEAGVSNAETVVAVTQDDCINTLSSVLAKRLGAKRTLALVSNSSYSSLVASLGIDAIINPRALTVSKILQNIYKGRMRSVYSLNSSLGEVLEIESIDTSGWVGMTVGAVNQPRILMVCAIIRGDRVLIPTDAVRLENGDHIILMVTPHAMVDIEKRFTNTRNL